MSDNTGKKTMSEAAKAANRENAKKSTGPKTEEGKAKSSKNAIKAALYCSDPLIPGEDLEEYRQFHQGIWYSLKPQNTLQWALFDNIAAELWMMQRLVKNEANLDTYIVYQDDHTDQLTKLTLIKNRKITAITKLLRELRMTRDRAFIVQHFESLLDAPSSEQPEILQEDPEAVVMQVDDVLEDTVISPGRTLRNGRDMDTSMYRKQVDMMLGLLENPNPTINDIIRNRIKTHPRVLAQIAEAS